MAEKFVDATGLAENIRKGELSASEALETVIERFDAVNGDLNILTKDMFEKARTRAAQPLGDGTFAGVPYFVKDMHAVAGQPTSFCTNATLNVPPAGENSAHVQALEDAGLNFCGLTTLGEFGYLPTTESLRFGPTRNPWNPNHSSGGSSGGSAAAVAAGILPMADAADGGGSIRIPAANCGLFGLKPSRGRNIGDFPPSAGVDLVVMNPVSRTVRDTAGLMAATERIGNDRVFEPMGLITAPLTRKLRVGVQRTSVSGHEPDPQVDRVLNETISLLEDMGHEISQATWPFDPALFVQAFGAVWMSSCASVNAMIRMLLGNDDLADHLERASIEMGALGAALTEDQMNEARAFILKASEQYNTWFDKYDVILSPVLLTPPPPIGHIHGDMDFAVLSTRVERHANYTMVQNATGAPAMSVPLGWSADGLPVGMQFAGPLGSDRLMLELAFALEEARPWIDRRPPIWAPDRVAP